MAATIGRDLSAQHVGHRSATTATVRANILWTTYYSASDRKKAFSIGHVYIEVASRYTLEQYANCRRTMARSGRQGKLAKEKLSAKCGQIRHSVSTLCGVLNLKV